MLLNYALLFLVSFIITFIFTRLLVPRLKRFHITGKDINKPGTPEVAEMGGIAIVAGFTGGILLAVFLNTFLAFNFNLVYVIAALITIHSVAFIGIVDDLLDVPQWVKAFLPLFAAIPLVAVSAVGSTTIFIPFIGEVNFGIIYILVLIPLAIAVSSNLTNMFGGFNGMESGLGIIIFSTLSLIAAFRNSPEMFILSISILGPLLAFFYFNKYPAKVFPGDVGNLTIGAVLATSVIIGNLESAGVFLILIYVVDFLIKAKNKFPSKNWWGDYKNGKLYPYQGKVLGLAQLVMKVCNGISEQKLVLFFFMVEAMVAIITLFIFIK
ncbi:MAG: hypothetical protein Q7S22_06175 [Candidatus Micrarchaeota archaeon]|nr:hypothetical protein [Candidatus Micrarchaeota archaeon]